MALARIRRIRKIGNYRLFQGWNDEGRPKEFARVNLIYGQNGSGKSTLASLLRDCSLEGVNPPDAALDLEVEHSGTRPSVSESDEWFWPRMRVFNADYMRQNLRFDEATGPSPDSHLTLGKPAIDAEKRLRKANERLADIQPKLQPAQTQAQTVERQLDRRMTEVAGGVVTDLRNSSVATYRATNTYTKAHVRKLLEGGTEALVGASSDVAVDLATALSSTMPAPSLASRATLYEAAAVQAARELVKTEVVVKVIDALRDHPDRAEWVQEGIALHEDLDTCLFCEQPLTTHRRQELAAHFDTTLTTLQTKISTLIDELEDSVEESVKYRDQIPKDGELYPELAGELRSARAGYRTAHDVYSRQAGLLIQVLKSKRSNPFQTPDLADDFELTGPPTAAVEGVIRKHQDKSDSHSAEVAAAAHRVELARVKEFSEEYAERKSDVAAKQAEATDLQTEIQNLRQEIVALQNVGTDPVPSAEELTKNVARLLGRADLKFTASADGKHYAIERVGRPARHLSEGERTAIALLHFLIGVRKDVTAGDEPIVVIDDPVSSLDDSILFGASSYLWSELVTSTFASQVFLLTHNFELFRQWLVQLENAGTRVADGFTVHEIRAVYRTDPLGEARRRPQFDPWTDNDKLSRRLRSQYHFLFARVAESVIEASPGLSRAEQMNVLALAPNAARKMLESFLSFRFPQHIGNFHAGVVAALGLVQDQAIRTHVERYLHAYSHNEEGDISRPVDPTEATTVLRSLFQMIRVVDEGHFDAMCKALLIDGTLLLTPPAGSLPKYQVEQAKRAREGSASEHPGPADDSQSSGR